MRNLLLMLVAVLLLGISTQERVSAQEFFAKDTRLAAPTRADLVVPPEIWDRVRDAVGYSGRPLGFTDEEMSGFRGSTHRLEVVGALFRDVTTIPRYTGVVSDQLLATPANFANAAAIGFAMIDARGGRDLLPPTGGDWGVSWIQQSAGMDEALNAVFEKGISRGIPDIMDPQNRAEWEKLPDSAKLLVLRVLVGTVETQPYIREAYDEDFLKTYFKVESLDLISRDALYQFAVDPWANDPVGASSEQTTTPRESFEALDRLDRNYLGLASVYWLTMVRGAIEEWQAWQASLGAGASGFGNFRFCEMNTAVGKVAIFGPGEDNISGDYSFVFDLGGNDTYTGSTAVPRSFSDPFGVVIDLGGNDKYDSGDKLAALACGMYGIGGIFDLGGNDSYTCQEAGIAYGLYGMGIIVDYAGDDTYTTKFQWGQAAGCAGVGLLIDLAGNDRYNTVQQSQGFGSTYGSGLLIDVAGNDVYYGDPEGNIDQVFEGRTVSFVQGAGFGRRADFGDGHSFGGGVGMLVDGAGDDSYTGSVYSQGAGYWWSLGSLEDRSGNDTYYNEQYSCGSAPHFAIGCAVDLSGDDKYNLGNNDLARQVQGCARDGSVGIFIDGSGNDQYLHRNYCAGSADLNCISLFWDRMGDDVYTGDRNPAAQDSYSYGNATTYPPFLSFRDEMASIGVFLDTGGTDTYTETWPADATSRGPALQFAENSEWHHKVGPHFWGFGLDVEWYSGVAAEEKQAE